MGNLGGVLFGAIVATLGWFIIGLLDLSWISDLFGLL